jgi:hypothetical protein
VDRITVENAGPCAFGADESAQLIREVLSGSIAITGTELPCAARKARETGAVR